MTKMRNRTKELGALDHLKELRRRCVSVLAYFVGMLLIALFFVPEIMAFIRRTGANVAMDLNIFNITDSVYLYMKLAGLAAFIMTMPFIILQVWWFVKPGLKTNEIRHVRRVLPVIFILFLAGISFAYLVIIPYYIAFSASLAKSNGLSPVIGAKMYVDFIVKTIWPFGLVFEFPMVVHVLSRVGFLNDRLLKAVRGYAYIGLMIVSAFLTPPDPISMGIMLVPLSLLYESSIWIACRNNRRYRQTNNLKVG